MGTWGKDLYNDDYVLDIKNDYIEGLRNGEASDKLDEKLIKYYACDNSDENVQLTFWIVLADIQWEYGRLSEEIKNKAVEILGNEKILDEWSEGFDKLRDIRKKQGYKILEKIQKPQPKMKRISSRKAVSDNWHVGDVFQYKIVIDDAERYKVPLFLNGEDTISNLEVSDMEVYWGIMAQMMP